ncbi:MAG: serine/threonine protein kinase [Sandaracinaceae bacterium]
MHEGAPFLVMERLLGESLEERWARAPMGMAELLEVFVAVCDGVAAAHRAGIVHRDLKPSNVFLCRGKDGSPRPPKVLDFGVAKVNDAHLTSVSVAGAIVGSPRFMAPEQLRGADPTPALDVYAIGVMLYRGVTGRLPFDHIELMPLIAQIEAARAAPVQMLAPRASPALASWIESAMARSPEARPALSALRDGLSSDHRSWAQSAPSTVAVSARAPAMHATPPPFERAPPSPARSSTGSKWLLMTVASGFGALLVLAGAFALAGVYFSQSAGPGVGPPSTGSLPPPGDVPDDGTCQGRAFFGELDGHVVRGQALCRLADPALPARVSIQADGCPVAEGHYEAYFEGNNGRVVLTHLPTLSSFVIGIDTNISGRVDLNALRRDGVPLYLTFTRNGVIWDNGLSNPGGTSGHVVIERWDVGGGRVHLRFENAQLSHTGGGQCRMSGELRAVGYTAAFPGQRGVYRP